MTVNQLPARGVLRTGRLVLHPLGMGDHAALLAHWSAPQVRLHLFEDRRGGGRISPERVTGIIEASRRDFATEGYGLWALRPAEPGGGPDPAPGDAPLLGVTGLRRQSGPDGVDAEIVYSLEPARWGQGLAAEAARAVLGYAFEVVGLRRVTAEIDVRNAASIDVAERLGMRRCRDDPDGPVQYAADRRAWHGSGGHGDRSSSPP
ncbi:GNAT family N-acetyltransferase [Spirillospora sp. NPDC127200]